MPVSEGEVSESEVLSMFDKDGDLRDEPQSVDDESAEEGQDEEPEEEEEAETEEEPEEEEEESEDEDEESEDEEEPEAELDWTEAAPEHKQAFEQSQKEVLKLRKDYGKIQSKLHELSQSRREEDQSLNQMRQAADQATQWNQILEQHPELMEQIAGLIEKAQNPESSIPEHLREDPAVQFMLQHNRRMEQQLKQLSEQTKPLNDWKAQEARKANETKLNGLLDDAAGKFKAMFKKDMGEKERMAVLKYMVENKYYNSGKNAVLEVFGDQYEKSLTVKETSRLREKAAKFGGRTKSVNSRRAASEPKIASEGDAIRQALREQGMEF